MEIFKACLSDNPRVSLQTNTILNLATLLPDSQGNSDLQHDCLAIIDKIHSSRAVLLDQSLTESDNELYTDGGSFMENDQQ